MKITPNQRFKHDGQTYEQDQEYDVSDELGYYFKGVGWLGEKKSGSDSILSIQDGASSHQAEVK